MTVAEPIQKKGMDGSELAKRWLESTTWIELPFNAYDNPAVCTLERLDGGAKLYDLFGYVHQQPAVPVYVEAKNYDSSGGKQPEEYWEFLANAYSITALDLKRRQDGKREFMWVTTHPFAQTDWPRLTTASRIQAALVKHPEVLHGNTVDVDLLNLVAERLWLLVVHQRQKSLMLSPQELAIIEGQLNRKAKK